MAGKHRDPLCALSAPVNVAQSLAPEGFTLRVKRDKGGWIYQHCRNRVHLSCSPFQRGCHANFLLWSAEGGEGESAQSRGPGRAPLASPRPFRKEPRGPGLLHLDPSRRRTRFCLGFQGRGVLFDPRSGQRWWHRARRAPAGPGGRGAPGTRAGCSQSKPGPVRSAPGPATYDHLGGVDPAQRPQDSRKARGAARRGMGRSVASPQNWCAIDAPISSYFLCFSLYSTFLNDIYTYSF